MSSAGPIAGDRPLRSLLFVPADNERKLVKSAALGADALIFDLEDAVLPPRKAAARAMLGEFLKNDQGPAQAWVRVNDLASGELLRDLSVAVDPRVSGIVLPKIQGPEDLAVVAHYLDAAESLRGCVAGSIRILAVCTETPAAVLRMGELSRSQLPRLAGLIWGAEDLSSALGAGDPRSEGGGWRPVYAHARLQCLLAAHALGIEAIDTVYVDFRNGDGCRSNCELARYDGFTGKIAVHPDQVAIINAAFTPGADDIAHARRVVAAFAEGNGAVSLDGRMLDMPHLKGAQRVLRDAGFQN
ncbi:HpcH/HpaI aldolase/citrate lyase family protein [Solimonas terrae]|uniref:CoA ester lyase n=1 Tax=Solimonas terrae TaxID=1396819 RepID=A0A6M2BXI7_9GAMM|nr:CoA ester lyase [Solimonas terrae]NGY07030.1 CoA ester lyase [Solimonas terrae]